MNGKYRVNEIANLLGVSQTTIYKRFAEMKKTMKPHYCKERGILLFDEIALNKFRESISTADKDIISAKVETDLTSPIKDKITDLKKAVLAMAEQMKALRSEVSALQKCLEYKKSDTNMQNLEKKSVISSEFQDVRADRRENVSPGVEKMAWWKLLWFEWFEPERLRKFEP